MSQVIKRQDHSQDEEGRSIKTMVPFPFIALCWFFVCRERISLGPGGLREDYTELQFALILLLPTADCVMQYLLLSMWLMVTLLHMTHVMMLAWDDRGAGRKNLHKTYSIQNQNVREELSHLAQLLAGCEAHSSISPDLAAWPWEHRFRVVSTDAGIVDPRWKPSFWLGLASQGPAVEVSAVCCNGVWIRIHREENQVWEISSCKKSSLCLESSLLGQRQHSSMQDGEGV